ncbi:hypothetical protein A2U01_0106704, partial [Trifolium medium]|nr:hypothetical protein [Trifolium medium]
MIQLCGIGCEDFAHRQAEEEEPVHEVEEQQQIQD